MVTLELQVKWPITNNISVAPNLKCSDIDISNGDYADKAGNVIKICKGFSETNLVQDVDRYRIRCSGGRIILIPHCEGSVECGRNRYNDISPDSNEDDCQTLVIILESPHKEEYYRNLLDQPIAPAQGATGSNLCGWLDEVLHGSSDLCNCLRKETRIILSNPIQFQTSLAAIIRVQKQEGENKKKRKICNKKKKQIRDAVWKELWMDKGIREDFKGDYIRFYPSGDLRGRGNDNGASVLLETGIPVAS